MRRRTFLGAMSAAAGLPTLALGAADRPHAGALRQLTDAGGNDNRATYLRDGERLVFASERSGKSQLWSMRPDGSDVQRLHQSAANDFGRVAPGPDGHSLCFSSDRGGDNALYILDLTDGAVRLLSDPRWWSFGPTWSADNLIAYFSRQGGNDINLWTVRPDGSQRRQITNRAGESRQPWFSPDGATLAYSANGGAKAFQVWLADADGAHAHVLGAPGDWQQPFWSPDGRQLAVSAKVGDGFFQIVVMDAGGLNARPIGQPAGCDNVHPAWSPDGKRIVFTSGRGKQGALWQFDLGGADAGASSA